jgi:hypothetical protein
MTAYLIVLFLSAISSFGSQSYGMPLVNKVLRKCVVGTRNLATATQVYRPAFEKQRKEYYERLLRKPWAPVARQRIALLESQNEQFERKIFGTSTTDRERYSALTTCMHESADILAENHTPQTMSNTVKDQCTQLLKEHCFKPGSIMLVAHKTYDAMASSQPIIYVGKKFLQSPAYMKLWHMHNPHCIKAVALHELQHLRHDDIVNLRLARSKVPLVNDYKCFMEQRADILAGLYDPAYAKALASHYHSLESASTKAYYAFKRFRPSDYARIAPRDGEPNLLARAAYLMRLHDQMKASVL